MNTRWPAVASIVVCATLVLFGCSDEGAPPPQATNPLADALPVDPAPAPTERLAAWLETLQFLAASESILANNGLRPAGDHQEPAVTSHEAVALVPAPVLASQPELARLVRQAERTRTAAAGTVAAVPRTEEASIELRQRAGTYDVHWDTRTYEHPHRYRCLYRGTEQQFLTSYQECCDGGACAEGQLAWVPTRSTTHFVHTRGVDAPTELPELMNLLRTAPSAPASTGTALEPPDAVSCRVKDVAWSWRRRYITCSTDEIAGVRGLTVEFDGGEVGWWTIGSVLSFPLVGEGAAYLTLDPEAAGTWQIHADTAHTTVRDPGAAPTAEVLLRQFGFEGTLPASRGHSASRAASIPSAARSSQTAIPSPSPSPEPRGGGTVLLHETTLGGTVAGRDVSWAIRQHLPAFRECYTEHLERNGPQRGDATLRFLVGAGGQILSAATQASTLADEATEACIRSELQTIVLPVGASVESGFGTASLSFDPN